MPTPDTDSANLTGESQSTIVRRAAYELEAAARTPALIHLQSAYDARGRQLRALADALEQTGSNPAFQGALTKDEWADRLEWVCVEYYPTFGEREYRRAEMDAALRKAFPEIAPHD